MRSDLVKISKFLSYLLRHHPDEFGISIDSEGYADFNLVLKELNKNIRNITLKQITRDIIEEIIQHSDKQRFQINGNKIRAYYGHSVEKKIKMNEVPDIPSNLFHGTYFNAYEKIKIEGLKRRSRQYVHLSDSIETAIMVARRRTKDPIILEIDVDSAKKEGIKFYKSGDMFLADFIPIKFISILNKNKKNIHNNIT